MWAPAASKWVASWRKDTISESSSTASSQPTTSEKRAAGGSGSSALVAVKALAFWAPPMAPFFDIHTKKPMIMRTGRKMAAMLPIGEAWWTGAVSNGIPAAWRSFTSSVPNWLGYEVSTTLPLSSVSWRTRLSSSMLALVILWLENSALGNEA